MSLLGATAGALGMGSIALPFAPVLPVHASEPGGFASTHYVDPGNTSGAASDVYTSTQAQNPSTPWATIVAAVAAAPTNSLVYVLGPYTTSTPITITTARTGWVYLRAFPGQPVSLGKITLGATARFIAIEGTSNQGQLTGDLVFTSTIDTVAGASKLRVRKIAGTNIVLRGASSAGCSDAILEDVTLRSAAGNNSITFAAGSTTFPVADVTIRRPDIAMDSGDGIHTGNPLRLLIEGGDFHDAAQSIAGTHCDYFQDVGPGADVTIRNSIFRDTTVAQGIFCSDGAIQRLWIENNLLYNLGVGTRIGIGSSQPDAVVLFNTILGRLSITEGATVLALMGNIISSLAKDNVGGTTTIQNEGYNLVAATSGYSLDPRSVAGSATFQNAAANDYRLAAGSLGRGLAVSSFAERRSPTTDRRGVARPVSGAWDAGSDGRF